MKTNSIALIALLFCLLGSTTSFGQAKGFAFGVKGGMNLSQLSMGNFLTTRYDGNGNPYLAYNGQEVRDNIQESLDSRTGFVGGVYARFGKHLFIQPEVLVSTKGGTFDIIRNDNDIPVKQQVDVRFSNIDVPILIGLKGGPFRLNAGPMASFRIGDNQKLRDAFRQYTSGGVNDALSQAVYGYQLGAGLDILGISIDVRREGTFTDLATFKVNTQSASSSSTVRQKLNSWQVTVGIKLI
ncbi:MAG: PorT family protein [Bacteroidetes bacterium]|nr:PorT family protein [Bacteroidota bacterium]